MTCIAAMSLRVWERPPCRDWARRAHRTSDPYGAGCTKRRRLRHASPFPERHPHEATKSSVANTGAVRGSFAGVPTYR
jgi:hypothetical protein